MDIEIYSAKNSKPYGKVHVTDTTSISDLKFAIHQQIPQTPKAERLSVRLEARGKQVKDTETLKSLGIQNGGKIYIKDLGPQIGWKTVFLAEYAGPLIVYLWVYTRPYVFYGNLDNAQPLGLTAHIAAACYTFHYSKRLLETIFVHRFSHATMPLSNLFKNCSYYWGFTAYVSYHVNHPLYTSPCLWTVYAGLAGFLFCELGNFSIHMTLRNLRPAGSKVRKIPVPDANPLSKLFNFVSCPNYTYEIGAWLCFSIMTKCFPALLFTAAGAYQMTMWALGKHRNYRKEFKDYPKRKAIFPFLI